MSQLTISPEVLGVLKRGTLTNNLFVLPPGNLERSLYEAVNKVLNNAGGVWTKKLKGHLFTEDPTEKLGLALETGAIENKVDDAKAERDLYQAFYTPAELAKRVVELADVEGKLVLEPSGGEGALVIEAYRQGAASVTIVEINPKAIAVLKENVISAVGEKTPDQGIAYEADFLKLNLKRSDFDRVVMNPPFTRNQDVKHVAHALTLLAPGGILVAIMADNVNRDCFREMLHGLHDYEIENVPAGAFRESGTDVKTIILTVRK
jgi:16S rRNA G966 N2-methylase RsmD